MNDQTPNRPRLGEIGLMNFAPYLMNRIMGRYNAGFRDEMGDMGLTTPKARALAVLSVVEGPLIRELVGLYRHRTINPVPRAGPVADRRPDPP